MSKGLTAILSALAIAEEDVVQMLTQIHTDFPDADEAAQAFTNWLTDTIGDQLTEEGALHVAAGVWAELQSGSPGSAPHHGSLA